MNIKAHNQSGMYSKAGQHTFEIFTFLQQRSTVLNEEIKQTKITESIHHDEKHDLKIKEFIKSLKKIDERKKVHKNKNSSKNNNLNKNIQPFARSISRDQIFKIRNSRGDGAEVGQYNPKYHLILKKCVFDEHKRDFDSQAKYSKTDRLRKDDRQLQNYYDRTPTKRSNDNNQSQIQQLGEQQQQSPLVKAYQSQIDLMANSKVKGFVELHKQLPRKELQKSIDVNEKRFEKLDFPNIYSNVQKIPTFLFESYTSRKDQMHESTTLQYDVRYNYVKPRVVSIPNFKKLEGRKSELKQIPPNRSDLFSVHDSRSSLRIKKPLTQSNAERYRIFSNFETKSIQQSNRPSQKYII